ncbi:hypothetical protein [Gulosibacter sp. 10]|uniref:hypothetical protein n=1 Tax=Gulosibacter sp. 10 TaxID=1255570 RepID=UPI00097F23A8|nr:hypothetical protein [Gulosibacter sp. 10]SJM54677.1 hypothetical protein FM112_03660 [Gulosibacter sp. 10]
MNTIQITGTIADHIAANPAIFDTERTAEIVAGELVATAIIWARAENDDVLKYRVEQRQTLAQGETAAEAETRATAILGRIDRNFIPDSYEV